jgi:archaeosine synthase
LSYPAQHYDIPVTGVWYEEEKSVIRDQLRWLIETFKYDSIIAHLDEDEAFMVDGFDNIKLTGGINAVTRSSLDFLTSALNEVTAELAKVPGKKRIQQLFKTMAMYHFGADAGSKLTEGTVVKGKYPYLKLFDNGKQLGMIEAETGLISLTLAGGQRILEAGAYGVEVFEFELKGDIFVPGVKSADPIIRPNDEVVVFSEKDGEKTLKAVGRATMSGNSMGEAVKGKAVKTRHFIKLRN